MRPSHWQRRTEVERAGIKADQKAVDETGRSRLEMTSVLWGLSRQPPSLETLSSSICLDPPCEPELTCTPFVTLPTA